MPASARGSPLHFLAVGCRSIGKQHIGNLIALGAGAIQVFDVQEDRFTSNFLWAQTP